MCAPSTLTEMGILPDLQETYAHYSAKDISQLQAQANSGDVTAQLKLARAYARGDGVPENEEMAAQWYRKAAEQGSAEAQDTLGVIYSLGQGVERDKQQAVVWYLKSARQGNAYAMFHLGTAYYNGDGVDINDSLSYAWFILAREAGNTKAVEAVQRAESELKPLVITRAYKKIAEMYEKGGSLPENQAEAAQWWLKAAKEGNAPGAYCMGYMAQHGMGGTSDLKEARKWYEHAAQSDHRLAMKALATMEAAGEGGKVDRPAACLLYARLAAAGDEDALRSLAKLRKQIDAKEWQKLEKRLSMMRIDPWKLDFALKQVDSQ